MLRFVKIIFIFQDLKIIQNFKDFWSCILFKIFGVDHYWQHCCGRILWNFDPWITNIQVWSESFFRPWRDMWFGSLAHDTGSITRIMFLVSLPTPAEETLFVTNSEHHRCSVKHSFRKRLVKYEYKNNFLDEVIFYAGFHRKLIIQYTSTNNVRVKLTGKYFCQRIHILT